MGLAIQSSKNAFALLLGSGISKAAGIPTGIALVSALLERALLAGNVDYDDPVAWYEETTGNTIAFEGVLEHLSLEGAALRGVLRPFFERTEEEDDESDALKTPTRAHMAIAELVRAGYVRVIITTNFDRLLEEALYSYGVSPVVIASEGQIEGAPAPEHCACYVLKPNGDYLSTMLRATPEDLSSYPQEWQELLERIFSSYGLVVAGWSADSDLALVESLLASRPSGFPTFWTARTELSPNARRIVAARNGFVVPVESADEIFQELRETLGALDDPLTSTVATTSVLEARIARMVADPKAHPRLEILLRSETSDALRVLASDAVKPLSGGATLQDWRELAADLEKSMIRLVRAISTLTYFSSRDTSRIVARSIARVAGEANSHKSEPTRSIWLLPSKLLFYAAGTAAIAAEEFGVLSDILLRTTWQDEWQNERRTLVEALTDIEVLGSDGIGKLECLAGVPGFARASQRMREYLHSHLAELVPDRDRVDDAFDLFEYIWSLTHIDMEIDVNLPPIGSYALRCLEIYASGDLPAKPKSAIGQFIREGARMGDGWQLLQEGFFRGSSERFVRAMDSHRKKQRPFLSSQGYLF